MRQRARTVTYTTRRSASKEKAFTFLYSMAHIVFGTIVEKNRFQAYTGLGSSGIEPLTPRCKQGVLPLN